MNRIFSLLKYPRSRTTQPVCTHISLRFAKRILKLGYVYNASGIRLVEQRLSIIPVIGNGIIKDFFPWSSFWMAKLYQIDVAGLAVFVCES